MKSFLAILALVAAPILALPAPAEDALDLAVRQSGTCRLNPAVFGNAGGAMPANLDGVCISTGACASVGGRSFNQQCGGGTQCCVKNDCAGQNSNSACLFPNLAGDTLRPGQAGAFVSGTCPPGLRCFQLSRLG